MKRRKFIRDKDVYEAGRILTYGRKYDTFRRANWKLQAQVQQEQLTTTMDSGSESDVSEGSSTGSPCERNTNPFLDEFKLIHQDKQQQQ